MNHKQIAEEMLKKEFENDNPFDLGDLIKEMAAVTARVVAPDFTTPPSEDDPDDIIELLENEFQENSSVTDWAARFCERVVRRLKTTSKGD